MTQYPFFVRFLMVSNIILISFIVFIFLAGFDKVKNFKEINAERINIIGTNGKPVLVISNRRLMPGPTLNGKTYERNL